MKKHNKAKVFTIRMLPLLAMVAALTVLFNYEQMKAMNFTPPFPMPVMLIGMALQALAWPVILCFLGQILAEKALLWKRQELVKQENEKLMVAAVIMGGVIAFIEKYFFIPKLAEMNTSAAVAGKPSLMMIIFDVLQGGITEEIMVRLFLMSLIVVILWQIFARKEETVPLWVLITANILSALIFTAGHLPVEAALFGWNIIAVGRCMLAYALPGIFYGWIYSKIGLPRAMQAHMAALIAKNLIYMFLV